MGMQARNKILVALLVFAVAAGAYYVGSQHAQAPEPPVETQDPTETDDPAPTPDEQHPHTYNDLVRVQTPARDARISSPLTIEGEARGNWYFEATFPVVLTDWDGRIIAEGYAQADGEWMTTEYVPFTATLQFEDPAWPDSAEDHFSRRGSLILQKANASGLPEHDDAYEFTVFFK